MKKKSKIFVSLFSFILIFNSLALPALAADSSAAGSPEQLLDYSKLTEDELLSIGTDLGDLPSDSYTPIVSESPMLSYNGTSLFDDLDDSDANITYVSTSADSSSDGWRPWSLRGTVTLRIYFLNSEYEEVFTDFLIEFDLDEPLTISLRKNTSPLGLLNHSIRFEQDTSLSSAEVFFFPELSLDLYQGFYCQVYDSRNNDTFIPSNGSFCEPTWNASYLRNGVDMPGYTAEFPQVYSNFVISSDLLEKAATGYGYIAMYAIPTYSGQYTVREYESNNIIVSQNRYGQIYDSYMMWMQGFNSGNIRINYMFGDATTTFNNLIPNPQRYAASDYVDHGPLWDLSLKGGINGKLRKSGSFPKYYDPSLSDISMYLASQAQYNDYLSSDTKVEDDINQQKQIYDERSEEFKDAIKGFEDLPKPNITSNTVILPSGSVESIDELSGILSIIWEDKMVKEMLIISLTFVFVGYILFGKRG